MWSPPWPGRVIVSAIIPSYSSVDRTASSVRRSWLDSSGITGLRSCWVTNRRRRNRYSRARRTGADCLRLPDRAGSPAAGAVGGVGRVGGEPVADLRDRPLGSLELRDVADVGGDREPPGRVLRRGGPRGGERDESILLAVQEEYRHPDRPHQLGVAMPAGQHPQQRPGGHQQLRVGVRVVVALAGQPEVL